MPNRAFALLVPPIVLAFAAPSSLARSLDGRWRGVTSGTPSGGNCRAFTFDIVIRANSTRRSGELRAGALHVEQLGSKACNSTRSGARKKS